MKLDVSQLWRRCLMRGFSLFSRQLFFLQSIYVCPCSLHPKDLRKSEQDDYHEWHALFCVACARIRGYFTLASVRLFSCDELVELTQLFNFVSISLQFFVYKRFDKNFQ